MNTRIP
ncbi:hypothetical protein Zm00014a_010594 [Zea mays]|nr:hypothetical protein Zm00014a_010594 [Zea mays]